MLKLGQFLSSGKLFRFPYHCWENVTKKKKKKIRDLHFVATFTRWFESPLGSRFFGQIQQIRTCTLFVLFYFILWAEFSPNYFRVQFFQPIMWRLKWRPTCWFSHVTIALMPWTRKKTWLFSQQILQLLKLLTMSSGHN